MQWSRRLIGLKVFMMFAVRGLDGIRRRIEHQAQLGDYLRARLRAAGWTILNETPLPVVCFTHASFEDPERRHRQLVGRVIEAGVAWISKTVLRGDTFALRACITNYHTTRDDVDRLVEALDHYRPLDPEG
jgi:glutamate/tyrosine decarboxylase-like PLP-dependent enzyme